MGSGLSRLGDPDQIKTECEGLHQKRLNLSHREPWDPLRQSSHGQSLKTTGSDQAEAGQITVNIQRKTMLRDPAATADADRPDLAVLQPETCQPRQALCLQSQFRKHLDHHLLQLTQIPVQVWIAPAQIKHRVDHQLSGEMVGHFPAAINAMQWQWRGGGIEAEVIAAGTAAKGETGWMFQTPNSLRSLRILEQTSSPVTLSVPSLLKRHRSPWLEKNCSTGVGRIQRRL